ncbi:uncharacterized protein TNCV_3536121 [Trichonephila clavipes]|uniref:Uncharacterized protein n=1 Tax=Trichonephila clavipes TaxID=2585209 RepID=A0A8X6VWL8_TRICX|nr:uncharacterized protein TNCV_3536121 [Trichonephila clavipes]
MEQSKGERVVRIASRSHPWTFFFSEKTVTSSTYLDILEIYPFLQLQDLQPNVLFQQDGVPPHWGLTVHTLYGTQVNSLEELKQNIQTAVATVDVSMLKQSWMELEYRLDIVRATKESRVEIS